MMDMTADTTFDPARAAFEDYLDTSLFPARLMVEDPQPLADAIHAGLVAPDVNLLTFERDGKLIALPMPVILSYNVIQSEEPDKSPWLMTFCNACNTGMVFDPRVDEQMLHFRRRGAYDGLLLIFDEETSTYWQHITGEALHGSSQGKFLTQLATTRQMTVDEAMAHPAPYVYVRALTTAQQKLSAFTEKMRANPERSQETILSTIQQEDTRRPRFELGLGLWENEQSLFVPLMMMHMNDNVLLTEFMGRKLLIYQHPDAISPSAVYLDTQHAAWVRDTLWVDNGASIRNDHYCAVDGTETALVRPNQLLMRWYGFALTFQGCQVYTG